MPAFSENLDYSDSDRTFLRIVNYVWICDTCGNICIAAVTAQCPQRFSHGEP